MRGRPRLHRRHHRARRRSDRYAGSFPVDAVGRWQFEVEAWVDRHAAWLDEHDRKVAAGQSDLAGELAEGEALFGPGSVEEWREAADALAAGDRKGASHQRRTTPRIASQSAFRSFVSQSKLWMSW